MLAGLPVQKLLDCATTAPFTQSDIVNCSPTVHPPGPVVAAVMVTGSPWSNPANGKLWSPAPPPEVDHIPDCTL
jgi:hypothetical protein